MSIEQTPSGERGSVIAVTGLIGAFVVVAALLLTGVTQRVVDRAQAQAAADAAALAGVADGPGAASAVAAANGAELVDFVDQGNEVSVIVAGDRGIRADAIAERRLEPVRGR